MLTYRFVITGFFYALHLVLLLERAVCGCVYLLCLQIRNEIGFPELGTRSNSTEPRGMSKKL